MPGMSRTTAIVCGVLVEVALLGEVDVAPGVHLVGGLTRAGAAGSAACAMCASGQAASSDQATCVVCAAGEYGRTSGSGAGATIQCAACPDGWYSAIGAADCTACGGGSIVDRAKTKCTACEAGRYEADHETCKPCRPGLFSDAGTSSKVTCGACPAGSKCPRHSNDYATGVVACPAGKTSAEGETTSCTDCGGGSIVNSAKTTCKACPAGKYESSHLSLIHI